MKPNGGIVGGGKGGGNGGSYTTTDKYGNKVVLSGTRSGEVVTTTDAAGRTVVMTYTPGGGAVSEVVVKTTKLNNGQESTITSYTNIGGKTQGAEQGGKAKGSPKLQGIAAPTGRIGGEMAALVGGAMGMAAWL